MLRYMAIGDVTSAKAAQALAKALWDIRKQYRIDFVAVNAENAGFIVGPSRETAEALLAGGADVLTGGNHTLQSTSLYAMLDNDTRLLRPANYPDTAPGQGYAILDAKGYRVLVASLLGRVHIEPPLDSPFTAADRILSREAGKYDLAFFDLHAEATGEKTAFAAYLDGRVSAVYGTHTHVPTADTCVLPAGTGYVTDLGMCGADGGILGVSRESVLERYISGLPTRFAPADGNYYADAVIFSADESTGKCASVERVRLALPTPIAK
ncbi:MAG: YmdB family metallophosphoesterase [Ruminococcaceae bacterium]|nr:YmdB family metallophosphoesterase [Oscillospiraceae bacterium]